MADENANNNDENNNNEENNDENKNDEENNDENNNNNNNNNKNKGRQEEKKVDDDPLKRTDIKKLLDDTFKKECGGDLTSGLYKIGAEILLTYQFCDMTKNNVEIIIVTWHDTKKDLTQKLGASATDLAHALAIFINTKDFLKKEEEIIQARMDELKIINKKTKKEILKQAQKTKELKQKEKKQQTVNANKSFVDIVLGYVVHFY